MPLTSKTLVFFGNERLVSGLARTDAPFLGALIEHGYHIAAVVSHHSEERSRKKRPLEVAEVAAEHNIPVYLPAKCADLADTLRAIRADAAILVAYGQIIPQSIIDIFPLGIINIHPSLLPLYRGPTPIESAILNLDSATGVSIMQLTAGMDAGPIYAQTRINLSGTETKFDLYHRIIDVSIPLLLEYLPDILDGTAHPTPQDDSAATYCHLLQKSDALLDPMRYTARQADARVRAHLGFPKSKLEINGHSIIVTRTHVTNTPSSACDIICQDGAYLSIDELIAPSGKSMSAQAFFHGYSPQ